MLKRLFLIKLYMQSIQLISWLFYTPKPYIYYYIYIFVYYFLTDSCHMLINYTMLHNPTRCNKKGVHDLYDGDFEWILSTFFVNITSAIIFKSKTYNTR